MHDPTRTALAPQVLFFSPDTSDTIFDADYEEYLFLVSDKKSKKHKKVLEMARKVGTPGVAPRTARATPPACKAGSGRGGRDQ